MTQHQQLDVVGRGRATRGRGIDPVDRLSDRAGRPWRDGGAGRAVGRGVARCVRRRGRLGGRGGALGAGDRPKRATQHRRHRSPFEPSDTTSPTRDDRRAVFDHAGRGGGESARAWLPDPDRRLTPSVVRRRARRHRWIIGRLPHGLPYDVYEVGVPWPAMVHLLHHATPAVKPELAPAPGRARARQRRASGSTVVRAKVAHVLQAVHDLVHFFLRGHRSFTDGVLRDVL